MGDKYKRMSPGINPNRGNSNRYLPPSEIFRFFVFFPPLTIFFEILRNYRSSTGRILVSEMEEIAVFYIADRPLVDV